jgi:hypothetical protein
MFMHPQSLFHDKRKSAKTVPECTTKKTLKSKRGYSRMSLPSFTAVCFVSVGPCFAFCV